ncbi:DUF3108 domain-containing protein [Kaistia defluvii]|uniref:DUF3108 domain-containing protein n=1 Tax=Kaistia defluvii TaxID=410841 RepID=A0ABV2R652_9HYPH
MQSLRLFRALVLPLLVAAAPVASVAPSAVAAPAQQQAGKVDAEYNILLGGLTIGRFALDTVFDDKGYTITARGSTSGVSRFVSDGKGFLKSSGRIVGSRVLPAAYMLDTSENGRRNSTVSMQMNSGTIVNVAAMPPLAKKADRVPLLPQHKRNIFDPLSAMIVPMVKGNLAAACNRTVPVFDGWQRFDVKLYYKGTAEVDGQNGSYKGSVVVCGARYVPVAGHRPTREAIEYMENNKALEVWLAPVESLGVMMPFRMQIGTEVGMLTIHASRFVGEAETRRAAAE